MKTIFFDTETTGLPPRNADPIRSFDKFNAHNAMDDVRALKRCYEALEY